MADEEMKKAPIADGPQLKEREKIENPSELLQDSLGGLNKFGGFQLLSPMDRSSRREKKSRIHPSCCKIVLAA